MTGSRRRDRNHAAGARATAVAAVPAPLPRALAGAVMAALAVRAAVALVPPGWVWGVDAARHLDPLLAWLPWLLVVAALVPAVGDAGARVLRAIGDTIATRSRIAALTWAAAAAAAVWAFPDQTRFVGDFLLRQGGAELEVATGAVSPQTMPLERWLADDVVGALGGGAAGASHGGRVIGALVAAGLGAACAAFARALGASGVAAAVTAALALGGGVLALCTGYPRGLGALALAAVLVAVGAVRATREGRGLVAASLGFALALGLHRIGLLLLPLLLMTVVQCARHGRLGAGPGTVSLLLPVGVLVAWWPRLAAQLTRNDLPLHFAAGFDPGLRALDLGNLLFLYAPAGLVALAVLVLGVGGRPGRTAWILGLLSLPAVLVAARFTPAQGAFRDTDAFVMMGVFAALAVAAVLGRCLHVRGSERLALCIVLIGWVPTVQWLMLHHDEPRGTARVRAVVASPPARPETERALSFHFVGLRAMQRSDWVVASEVLAQAAMLTPAPGILRSWGLAAMQARDYEGAARAYTTITRRDPVNSAAWMGRAVAELRLRRLADARASAESLLALPHATDVQRRVAERVLSGADELEMTPAAPGLSAPR